MKLRVEILSGSHEKKGFECGTPLLDNYIRTQAKQDVNRDLSACFVLLDEFSVVQGYYTLSATSIKIDDFPEELRRKLPPSYVALPGILLGRFAINRSAQGKGYGGGLLINALKRCLRISKTVGSIVIVVDPIDERAKKFYAGYGFVPLSDSPKMILPMKTIADLTETI